MNTAANQDVQQEFAEWFQGEIDKGLVDLKLAINNSASNNPSSRMVMETILDAERKIAAGEVLPHCLDNE